MGFYAPAQILRDALKARKMTSCERLQTVMDARWIELAGIVLVRQKPGSAMMFIPLEDEGEGIQLIAHGHGKRLENRKR